MSEAKHYIIRLSGLRLFLLGSSFLLNIAAARSLSAQLSGQFFLLLSIFSFFSLMATGNLEKGLFRFRSQLIDALPELNVFVCVYGILSGVIFALIAYVFLEIYEPSFFALYGYSIYGWALLLVVAGNLQAGIQNLMLLQDRAILPFSTGIVINILSAVFLWLLPDGYFSDDQTLLWTVAGCYALQGWGLMLFLSLKVSISGAIRALKPMFKKVFLFALPLLIANLFFLAISRIELLIVNKYAGGAELGNYIQSSRVMLMIVAGAGAITTSIFNQLTIHGQERVKPSVQKIIFSSVGVLALALVLNIVWGQRVFTTVFGEDFALAHQFFNVHLISAVVVAVSGLFTAWVLAFSKPFYVLMGSVLGVCIILVAGMLLVPRYGAMGGALAALLAYGAEFLVILYAFRKM